MPLEPQRAIGQGEGLLFGECRRSPLGLGYPLPGHAFLRVADVAPLLGHHRLLADSARLVSGNHNGVGGQTAVDHHNGQAEAGADPHIPITGIDRIAGVGDTAGPAADHGQEADAHAVAVVAQTALSPVLDRLRGVHAGDHFAVAREQLPAPHVEHRVVLAGEAHAAGVLVQRARADGQGRLAPQSATQLAVGDLDRLANLAGQLRSDDRLPDARGKGEELDDPIRLGGDGQAVDLGPQFVLSKEDLLRARRGDEAVWHGQIDHVPDLAQVAHLGADIRGRGPIDRLQCDHQRRVSSLTRLLQAPHAAASGSPRAGRTARRTCRPRGC